MTELEKMKRAKNYLDKMAQGIDPITNKPVPDTECICQERISKCLTYVSALLEKTIEEKNSIEVSLKASKQSITTTPSTAHFVSAQKQRVRKNNGPGKLSHAISQPDTVKIGSTVILIDSQSGEKLKKKLISGRTETRYKTMGYKTKNYSETYQTSDADGDSTISDQSPLGKAILNRRAGDTVEYEVEGNRIRYLIHFVLEK